LRKVANSLNILTVSRTVTVGDLNKVLGRMPQAAFRQSDPDWHFLFRGVMYSNLYEILHVDPYASERQIKSSYRRLLLTYHPDKAGPEDVEKFLEVQHAYSILSDKAKRDKYDRQRHWQHGPADTARQDLKFKLEKKHPSGYFLVVEITSQFFQSHSDAFSQLQDAGHIMVANEGPKVGIHFNSEQAYRIYRRLLSKASHNRDEPDFFAFEARVLSKLSRMVDS
jgi:curved DNA-binding protein CbpA